MSIQYISGKMAELREALENPASDNVDADSLFEDTARAVLEADEWKICVTHHSRAALANFCQFSHMCSMMGNPTNLDCYMVSARIVK